MSAIDAVGAAMRLSLYAVLMLLFGLAGFALPRGGRPARLPGWRGWSAAAAALGIALTGAQVTVLAAAMAGLAPAALDAAAIRTILTVPAIGGSIAVRLAALILILGTNVARSSSAWPLRLILIAAGVALASLVWLGHGTIDAGAGGALHRLADVLHLLAAAAWIGAIAGLLTMIVAARRTPSARRAQQAWEALAGFARSGTWLVGTIIVTGLINVWAIVTPQGIAALPATLYGRLLIAKLLLFGAMVAIAAINRFRHVPALRRALAAQQTGAALARLRRSLAAEALLGGAVLIAVAWLGMLDPGGAG